MYIKFENETTSEFYDADIMGEDADPVDVDDDGTARAPQDVAEALIESGVGVTEHPDRSEPRGEPTPVVEEDDEDEEEDGTDEE